MRKLADVTPELLVRDVCDPVACEIRRCVLYGCCLSYENEEVQLPIILREPDSSQGLSNALSIPCR